MADEALTLSVWDYVVFALLLTVSVIIGLYAAFSGGRQRTSAEYVIGNQEMNFISVGLSLAVSYFSALGLLGTPAEIYLYNFQYFWNNLGYIIACVLGIYTIVPFFYKLNMTSVFTYIEERYKSKILTIVLMVSLIFQMCFYNALVTYTPAIALDALTGIGTNVSILITGLVCITYTVMGGIKAVIWSDAFQSIIMTVSMLVVCAVATAEIGGPKETWRIAEEGGRGVWFDFPGDATVRNTFLNTTIAFFFNTITMLVDQGKVQRYLSCSSVKKAQMAMYIDLLGYTVLNVLTCFAGIVMYSYYATCDPVLSGKVERYDQVFVYLTLEVFQNAPGVTGIFLAGIYAGTLSTLSTTWNGLANIVGENMIKHIRPGIKERNYTICIKLAAIFWAVISITLAFMVQFIGEGVLAIALSIAAISAPGWLATFIMGMYTPQCNSQGMIAGVLASAGIILWLNVGAMLYPEASQQPNPLSVEGCLVENSTTVSTQLMTTMGMEPTDGSGVPLENWYGISYQLYPPIGFVTAVVFTVLFSALTGFNKPSDLDPRLYVDVRDSICCCLPEKWREKFAFGSEEDRKMADTAGKYNVAMELEETKAEALDKEETKENLEMNEVNNGALGTEEAKDVTEETKDDTLVMDKTKNELASEISINST